jgi:hypothetical protein
MARKLDEVLVVDRGVDGLELHLHGAPAVLETLHRVFGLDEATAPTTGDEAAAPRVVAGPTRPCPRTGCFFNSIII